MKKFADPINIFFTWAENIMCYEQSRNNNFYLIQLFCWSLLPVLAGSRIIVVFLGLPCLNNQGPLLLTLVSYAWRFRFTVFLIFFLWIKEMYRFGQLIPLYPVLRNFMSCDFPCYYYESTNKKWTKYVIRWRSNHFTANKPLLNK